MIKIAGKALIVAVIFLCVYLAAHGIAIYLKQFSFDEDKALDKWSRMVLNGQVEYTLMKEGENGYVQALSEKTCSALYYNLGFKLKDYPILTWKWRVLKFPDISKASSDKERDDYAARVYVIFPFLNFSSSKFIEYIWAQDIPQGTIMDSPVGSNVKMVVVRSGAENEGQWISEKRNIYEDYQKAFGSYPNRSAGAIAIMCDADSTKTSAESLFDDIAVESEAGAERKGE